MSDEVPQKPLVATPTRESELAKAMGMTRKALSDLRKQMLIFQTHWYREESPLPAAKQAVWITELGVEVLAKHWGVPIQAVEAEKKNLSVANATEVAECSVLNVFPRNPRLVEVLFAGEKRLMRVKDGTKWVKGMKVQVRTEGGMSRFLIPLRNPRFRGKF
jgi:hypothetical protein